VPDHPVSSSAAPADMNLEHLRVPNDLLLLAIMSIVTGNSSSIFAMNPDSSTVFAKNG
jgi:hypothetical protein